jgi:hypothetical protein
LIRSIAAKIELDFFESAALLNHLVHDGQRVLKSILAIHWELLNRIKENPAMLLAQSIALNRREMGVLRLKQLLGTEGSNVPFVAAAQS